VRYKKAAHDIEKMLADFNLAMSAGKTETADFKGGLLASAKPIQYLGFTFDGLKTLIRLSSLDAYRLKMRRGIHAKLVAAKMNDVPSSFVYERALRSRYTHAGKRRNFLRYASKAADFMDSYEIRQQVKPHMTWFNRVWEKEVGKVYGGLVASA
jgi:RNA-directed DNA polymerase